MSQKVPAGYATGVVLARGWRDARTLLRLRWCHSHSLTRTAQSKPVQAAAGSNGCPVAVPLKTGHPVARVEQAQHAAQIELCMHAMGVLGQEAVGSGVQPCSAVHTAPLLSQSMLASMNVLQREPNESASSILAPPVVLCPVTPSSAAASRVGCDCRGGGYYYTLNHSSGGDSGATFFIRCDAHTPQ